jgi:hypothetical protein
MSSHDFFKKLSDHYPFITICHYANNDYVGIVQNKDEIITTIYDYGSIVDHVLKARFLELGEVWWWESNRTWPINIFLKEDWAIFKPYLRTFNNKGLEILHGPVVSMTDLSKKRSKRRSITLVKRIF